MKTTLIIFFSTLPLFAFPQVTDTVDVAFNKTVILVFSSNITDAEPGSGEVMVIKSKDGKKLKLRAGIHHFKETNLLVETENGLFAFILKYNETPADFFLFPEDAILAYERENEGKSIAAREGKLSENSESTVNNLKERDSPSRMKEDDAEANLRLFNQITEKSEAFLRYPQIFRSLAAIEGKITMIVSNMKANGDQIYILINLINDSSIPYEVNYWRFNVEESPGLFKSMTADPDPKQPVYQTSTFKNYLDANSSGKIVFVFDSFTFQKDENIAISVNEMHGDRDLEVKIDDKTFLEIEKF